jgi:hypothetical protein
MRRIGGDVKMEMLFILNNFHEGGIVKGDTDTPFQWRPIESITDEMQKLWEDSAKMTGPRYYDIFIRK